MPAHDRYVDTWKAFVKLRSQELARSIGVSNFQPAPGGGASGAEMEAIAGLDRGERIGPGPDTFVRPARAGWF